LNAGYGSEILDLEEFFSDSDNPFPFAMFCEEEAALNSAPTSIGIVLTEDIYTLSAAVRNREVTIDDLKLAQERALGAPMPLSVTTQQIINFDTFSRMQNFDLEETLREYTTFHYDLIERMNRYGLAK
jgi:hypothetical protein